METYLWGSALCTTSSLGMFWLSRRKRKQLAQLKNAKNVKDDLKFVEVMDQVIEILPEKRVYVKGYGRIMSDEPLMVKTMHLEDPEETMVPCVLRRDTVKHINEGIFNQVQIIDIQESCANNVYIQLSEASSETPKLTPFSTKEVSSHPGHDKLIITMPMLKLAEQDIAFSRHETIGKMWISALLSIVAIPWPTDKVTTTSLLPSGKNIFFAGDLVKRGNEVTLVQPISPYRQAALTTGCEQNVQDKLKSDIVVWELASIASYSLGLMFLYKHLRQH